MSFFCNTLALHSQKRKSSTPFCSEYDAIYTDVQKTTFNYFWDGAEPVSGLARERLHVDDVYPENDKNTVTIGGSGFGVMAIFVGIERKFITRQQGFERLLKIPAT